MEMLVELEKSVKIYEATTTESATTTLSQSEQRKKEKEELLSIAASMIEKLREVEVLLKTSILDAKEVGQIQTKSRMISTQASAIMDNVRKMNNLNDDSSYATLIQV